MKSAINNTRIVIDTNVFVSAIVFGGQPRKILDLLAHDVCTVVIAEEILTEMRRIIAAKFPRFLVDLAKIEKMLEADAQWVQLGGVTIRVSRDPDDDKIIETAVVGDAGYIISGDKDLLVLERYKNIRILRPADFLDIIS